MFLIGSEFPALTTSDEKNAEVKYSGFRGHGKLHEYDESDIHILLVQLPHDQRNMKYSIEQELLQYTM